MHCLSLSTVGSPAMTCSIPIPNIWNRCLGQPEKHGIKSSFSLVELGILGRLCQPPRKQADFGYIWKKSWVWERFWLIKKDLCLWYGYVAAVLMADGVVRAHLGIKAFLNSEPLHNTQPWLFLISQPKHFSLELKKPAILESNLVYL